MSDESSRKGAALLIGQFPVCNAPDLDGFTDAVAMALSEYSESVAVKAMHDLVRSCRYPPSAAEVHDACRAVIRRRREMLATIDEMARAETEIAERARAEAEAAERKGAILAAIEAARIRSPQWHELTRWHALVGSPSGSMIALPFEPELIAGDADAIEVAKRTILIARLASRRQAGALREDIEPLIYDLLRGEWFAAEVAAGDQPAKRTTLTHDEWLAASTALSWPLIRWPKHMTIIDIDLEIERGG
jgi:hypothetical protein